MPRVFPSVPPDTYEVIRDTTDTVWWCPFCLWSVLGGLWINPYDLEELFRGHMSEHVEEMCSV